MLNIPIAILLAAMLGLGSSHQAPNITYVASTQILSTHIMPMADRFPEKGENEIFKFNILLNADYLAGEKFNNPQNITMADVDKPFSYSFTLKPGETFAFHDQVLPKYQSQVVKTTNSQFDSYQGFKSDGYLYGDGVCHLASLLNWVASDAGLAVEAPTNHDFRQIPDIPKKYGTAILYSYDKSQNAKENLYITNTKDKDVKITLNYKDQNLESSVEQ